MKYIFTVLISLSLLAASIGCRGSKPGAKSEKIQVSGIVLFIVGSAMIDGQAVKPGDQLKSGSILKVGSGSICDLQVKESNSVITVRLKDNAEFRLSAFRRGDRDRYQMHMTAGQGLFRVDRLNSSEEAMVVTPTSVASVRGTKFETSVGADGSSSTAVFEGQVAGRQRMDKLEDLPSDLVQSSEVLGEAVAALEKSESVIEAGHSLSVDRSETDKQMKSNPELDAVLSRPEIANLRGRETASQEEIKTAASTIDREIEDPAKRESLRKSMEASAPKPPEALPPAQLQQKIQECEELIAIEKDRLKDDAAVGKAVSERNQQQRAALSQRIEQIMNKPMETLILKNGTRVQGVIIQEGSDYTVLTVEGRQFIRGDQVQGFAF